MILLSLVIVGFLIFQDLFLGLLLIFNFKKFNGSDSGDLPQISILIPCRDEAENILSCLHSLELLEYPLGKIQLILADDGSTDATAEIILEWQKGTLLNVLFLSIQNQSEGINGKANALAQMARKATGEVLLFTDADCQVPAKWAISMVNAHLQSEAGMVTGVTKVEETNLFSKMQGLDWWLTLGMVKAVSDIGHTLTSMGNNMLVTKKAYNAVGGFEGIPFSLTEDFEMARQVKIKGFKAIHLVSGENLIHTKGQENFWALLSQRKRWMYGAIRLQVYWIILLGLQVFFFPAIIFFIIFHPFEGILFWLLKVLIQGLFIYGFASKTSQKLNIRDLALFEIYYLITAWSTIVYYFWPAKTDWKGRKYG